MPTPYIGFGNDTLARLPRVKAGDSIACPNCGARHVLEAADDGSELMLFYRCGTSSYLGAVQGRLVIGVRPDVSGRL